ncbi:MAG: hypothetical protein EON54_20620 [Alcaligenaceae bacterium]|nr:MAG: hypothetical protein EON54_20620 [Alcaligenaceae bacterium]
MKIRFIFLLACLLSTAAVAQDDSWKPYALSQSGNLQQLREDRTVKESDDVFLVWTKTTYNKPYSTMKNGGPPFSTYSVERLRVDCRNNTSQSLADVYYGKDGTVLNSYYTPAMPQVIVPDTVGEALLKAVCVFGR